MTVILFWFLVWLASMAICAQIAGSKYRSAFGWALLGFLFGPLAILAVAIVPKNEEGHLRHQQRRQEVRQCPFCAEFVKSEATVCKHCRNDLPPFEPAPGMIEIIGEKAGRIASRFSSDGYRS